MATTRLCSIPYCGKVHYGHGWCSAHYTNWRRHGDPLWMPDLDEKPICSVDGCDRQSTVKGWCGLHYQRWRKHGDPLEANGTERGTPLRFLREVVLKHDADECLPWPFSTDQNGYGKVRYEGRSQRVNGIVCALVHGPAPTPEHEVAHTCGKGKTGCCAPLHLAWKTHTENEADKIIHGTCARGERHGMARLTNDEVRTIRALAGTMLQREIADIFGVLPNQISEIINRRTYASIN